MAGCGGLPPRSRTTAAAGSVWFPIALPIAFGLYLILQRRLDRGPKLLATGYGSPEDEVIEI